jgi:hypothetical protein
VAALAVLLIVSQSRAPSGAASSPGDEDERIGQRPDSRRAAGRRAAARRAAAPGGAGTSRPLADRRTEIAAIQQSCTDAQQMRRMFHRARKVLLGKLRGDQNRARLVLEALLTAECTPEGSRHWVSYYLTMAHIKAGRCAKARRAWEPYRKHHTQTHGKPPTFPPCR